MTATVATFRSTFAPFADPAKYPDAVIQFWIDLGLKLHSADRYGDVLDTAIYFFIAHNLTLEAQSQASAAQGQGPGAVQGALTSASVDKVSYSRDASSAMDPANGHWNLTSYGLRWIQLQRLMGAGPVQVGVPSATSVSYGAWPGPFPLPW